MKNQQFIEKALKKESFQLSELENFTSLDEAKQFFLQVYKNAQEIVAANDGGFFVSKMCREVEAAYYLAVNADCSFMVHTYAELALGWFVKMVNTYGNGNEKK